MINLICVVEDSDSILFPILKYLFGVSYNLFVLT